MSKLYNNNNNIIGCVLIGYTLYQHNKVDFIKPFIFVDPKGKMLNNNNNNVSKI